MRSLSGLLATRGSELKQWKKRPQPHLDVHPKASLSPLSLHVMENRGPLSPSLPEPRSSMTDIPSHVDEELDQDTVNFISALYSALGPLLPEVTQLQIHQDPPVHLMVDMKAKLRELGSSVSDARKRLLRYNIYLKKRLARALQEKAAWREQQAQLAQMAQVAQMVQVAQMSQVAQAAQMADAGTQQPPMPRGVRMEMAPGKSSAGVEKNIQEAPAPEFPRIKPPERVHRRTGSLQDPRFATVGQEGMRGHDKADDHCRGSLAVQAALQRNAARVDAMPSRPLQDRGQ
nr:PREDICTED: uncharacterized protein LOC103280943 [Anolis carolinensis]|eukprot:XP_008119567.1 PREDICTED: uncharacterized protein LOC103280943 [Anolis carolinensis]